jgi:hypothetical protein
MTTPLEDVLRSTIRAVLEEYIDSPFALLREWNQQARLAARIQQALAPAGLPERSQIEVAVQRRRSKTKVEDVLYCADLLKRHYGFPTERVQGELEVLIPGMGAKVQEGRKSPEVDIVILGDGLQAPVRFLCFANGAHDIVRKARPQDVDALIELKAACSNDPASVIAFQADVKRLAIARIQRPELRAHFVLFDKSLALKPEFDELYRRTRRRRPVSAVQKWWGGDTLLELDAKADDGVCCWYIAQDAHTGRFVVAEKRLGLAR